MKLTPVFRTHFGMRAPAGLAGSVMFSATTGSARLINRGGAAPPPPLAPPAAAGALLSATGCCRIAAATKKGENSLVGWLLAAAEEADEGAVAVAVVFFVGHAKPCWKDSANRANTRRGRETRKRKHIIIIFPKGRTGPAFFSSSPARSFVGFFGGRAFVLA